MLKAEKLDEFVKQISAMMPNDLSQTRQDLEKNLKAALTSIFARMDLVTREEFNIQTELLSKTRELMEKLDKKVSELESGKEKPIKD